MTDIKLIALDMDGTTLNSDNKITRETEIWIQKAIDAGITVIFATGRGMPQVTPFREQIGLDSQAVLLNGGEVWGKDDELLERHLLESSLIPRLHELAVSYDTCFWGYTTEARVLRKSWTEDDLNKDWLKFGYLIDDRAVIKQITETVKAWDGAEVTSSDWNNVEVNPKGVTKATGVNRLCQSLGLTMDQVMAVGDSLNDYALFCEAGLSIAMGNADETLLKVADAVTDTNDQDGVAKAIQKYGLKI